MYDSADFTSHPQGAREGCSAQQTKAIGEILKGDPTLPDKAVVSSLCDIYSLTPHQVWSQDLSIRQRGAIREIRKHYQTEPEEETAKSLGDTFGLRPENIWQEGADDSQGTMTDPVQFSGELEPGSKRTDSASDSLSTAYATSHKVVRTASRSETQPSERSKEYFTLPNTRFTSEAHKKYGIQNGKWVI
ncbi:hypothetical protein IAT40_007993 [Kwoniella sp. CBS 6097]